MYSPPNGGETEQKVFEIRTNEIGFPVLFYRGRPAEEQIRFRIWAKAEGFDMLGALEPLITLPNWIVCRKGKTYQPNNPRKLARLNKSETWGDYATARKVAESGAADGIGFCLFGTEFSAIDLDDCRNPETGEIAQWALERVTQLASYTEVKVGGTGLHIIGRGTGTESYIAMTGEHLTGTPLVLENLDVDANAAFSEEVGKPHATLGEINNDFCVVRYGGKVRIMTYEDDGDRKLASYYSAADFKLMYCNQLIPVDGKNQYVPLGLWWLNHKDRRQYDGVVFEPGKGMVVNGRLLNLWRGWGIEPKAGDWSLLRKHIEEVLADGNEAHADYILRWTAWTLQNPGTPPEVALVFRGGKGTGKGVFGRALVDMFGQHGAHINSHGHLTGNFNRHLQDCALLFADEAFWPGDKSSEGTLKRIVTEPTLFIEAKGVDGRMEKNRLHIVIAANADWVIPASIGERRFGMFEVSDKYQQDKTYFGALYKEMASGGIAAMMHDLLALDLGDWHPRQDVPKTKALADQQRQSLPDKDQWWVELLADGCLPMADPKNPRRAPSQALFEQARTTVPRLRFASEHELGRYLSKQGCRDFKTGGRGWEFPPLKEARADWASKLPTEWDDPDRDWAVM